MKNDSAVCLVAAILLVGASAVPENAQAGPERDARRSDRMIRACVAEIGRRLEYPQAAEVLHRVTGFRQKNLAETEVRIETAVTERDAGNATHRYEARCVTGPLTEIVDFRLREAARPGARSDAAPLDQKASQVSVFAASS